MTFRGGRDMFSFLTRNKVNSVNASELGDQLGKINLIDIREPNEYKSGHLPAAKNIPMEKILTDPEKFLNKDKEYHIICQSGGRSSSTCKRLKSKGFNVINVSGGTGSYRGELKK